MDLFIVGIYFLVMLLIGAYAYRKGRASRSDSFYVADRKGSGLLITGSLLATIVGASATVGMAGWGGFLKGLSGGWWLLAGTLGLLVLSLFWARTVRRFGLYTLPELVEKQYGREAGFVASVLIVVSWVGIIAAQISAAGAILSVLISSSSTLTVVIPALVFIAYTILGAQYSIIRTDFIQSGILMVGILITVFMVLNEVGWLSGLKDSLPSEYFSFPVRDGFGWYDLVSLVILAGATYVVGPDIYSRIFCARDEKVAKTSALSVAMLIVPIGFAIVLIGMGAKVLFSSADYQQAFPLVIQEVLPVGLSGLVIAALLAAIMSSADTCLLTTSTILSEDIAKKLLPDISERKGLVISRLGIFAIGIVALVVVLETDKGIIDNLLLAYTVFTSGIVLPVLAGFYKERLRVNSWGALAAIIGGGTTALVVKLKEIDNLELLGLGVCVLLLFGVSWATKRNGLWRQRA